MGQHPDKLEVKYGPDSKLDTHDEDKYYRVYTDTSNPTPPEISQPLSKPLHTREMKTAIMKRWLDINSQENPLEPKFNIGVYLSEAEQYSTLFHLMELGDENAGKYYFIVNNKIIGNPDLFKWLHDDFKSKDSLQVRRRYLSFKYLSVKLTGNFTNPKEGELTGLNYILLEQARNTIIYDEKKKLVEEFFEAFKKFTENPRHFEYVKDLDYFFLVFESLLSIETTEEGEEEAGEQEAGEDGPGEEEEAAARAAEEARARATKEARARAAEEARARAAEEAEEAAAVEEDRAAEPEAGAEAVAAARAAEEAEAVAAARAAEEAEAVAAARAAEEAAKIEVEAKTLQETYSFAINFTLEENKKQYFTPVLYDAYFLYKKMSELSTGDYKGIEHIALQQYLNQILEEDINAEKETKKREFDELEQDEKNQIIFGFNIAYLDNVKVSINGVEQVFGEKIIERAKTQPEDWYNFYLQAIHYIEIMRKVQELLKTQNITELYKQAEEIMKRAKTIPVRPIFKDSELLEGPYDSVYGVFVVDAQYGAKCGLHAINNLLQIKKKDCLATADTCELSRVLKDDTASGGNNLQSQQIVNIINGTINDANKELHPDFLNLKYFAEFIPPNDFELYDRLRGKKSGNKKFLGIIEKQVGHYVAWLLKKMGDEGEYIWLVINSFGTITPYSYNNGLIILKSRPKNLVGAEALGVYEHIAVYEAENARITTSEDALDISKCFVNDDITNINDETPAPTPAQALTKGSGRIRKNKSKRRYTSKKRTGKKSKKIMY